MQQRVGGDVELLGDVRHVVPNPREGALVFGADSGATAGDGNSNLAAVFGSDSSALAGGDFTGSMTDVPGNNDIAAVFGDLLNAFAFGGSGLVDIMPSP